jgi:hypothetical protein
MSFLDNMGGGGFLGFNNLETALQNLNKNLSQLIQSLGNVTWNGTNAKTSSVVTTSTLIYAGSGTLVNFAVTVAGSASGTINNSATTAGAASSNVICATPNTVGIVAVGSQFTNGLVVSPGSGQSVNVTYIPG